MWVPLALCLGSCLLRREALPVLQHPMGCLPLLLYSQPSPQISQIQVGDAMCQTYSLVVLAALPWFCCQISRRSQTGRVEPGSPFPKGDKEREVSLDRAVLYGDSHKENPTREQAWLEGTLVKIREHRAPESVTTVTLERWPGIYVTRPVNCRLHWLPLQLDDPW